METIGEQLKTARKAAGLSAYRLARTLGVTPSNYARWESGETMPGAATFQRILAAIDEHDNSTDS